MTVHAITTGGKRPEDALAQLSAEIDAGIAGVIMMTIDEGGTYRLTVCGDVSSSQLALASLELGRVALDLSRDD